MLADILLDGGNTLRNCPLRRPGKVFANHLQQVAQQNGDGKVDINDVIISLGGKIGGGGLFGSILGGLFKRK